MCIMVSIECLHIFCSRLVVFLVRTIKFKILEFPTYGFIQEGSLVTLPQQSKVVFRNVSQEVIDRSKYLVAI